MQILDWKKGRFQKAILDCRRVALKNAVETTAKKNQTIRCWDQAKPWGTISNMKYKVGPYQL